MSRSISLLVATLGAAILAAEPSPSLPLAPTRITLASKTLADALAAFRAARLPVEAPTLDAAAPCSVHVANVPFWEALEAVADQTGTRIALGDHGRTISLVKREAGREPSSIHGPFRIVARQVVGRLDLETGRAFQEVRLEVHWEPHFPVFRIDSVPTITTATDDLGNSLEAASTSAMSPVAGAASHTLPVRLLHVPRKAQTIRVLAGSFVVTASERLLPFAFDLGGALPRAGTLPEDVPADVRGKVRATLQSWQRETYGGKRLWEAQLHLVYPPGMPVFQSFETWLGENKLRLVSPERTAYAPDQVEEPGPGREMTVVYRFDAAKLGAKLIGKGWTLIYDTPAPLVEFRVPFELRNVPLP